MSAYGIKAYGGNMSYYLAVDIDASGGRHTVGWLDGGKIITDEVYSFRYGVGTFDGHLVWDTHRLLDQVKAGIKEALLKYPQIASMSVDAWGMDYVLLRGDEEVLPAYACIDPRAEEAVELVHEIVPREELYSITGAQPRSLNTVYQLYADKLDDRLDGVTDFLMMPEYVVYRLTGIKRKELTNASAGALVNVNTLQLDENIFSWLGFPQELAARLYSPGELVGRLTDEVAAEVGGNLDVVLCATHGTASAVEAIDIETGAPCIYTGGCSLLGAKLNEAVTDAESLLSGFSNEWGVGYFIYVKSVAGMRFIKSLCDETCPDLDYLTISRMAEESSYKEIFDVGAQDFAAPESMKGAIDAYFASQGKPAPRTPADYFNSAYHSIAASYDDAIRDLELNTDREYSEVYVTGFGAKSAYLNDLIEKYTGKRVIAMPIEAAAIGNIKVQMLRAGELSDG